MKGSMTIEASYIFPFCFLVIGIVCYLGIFQYNQAVLKMTGYECILQTMELREKSESVLRETIMEKAEKKAKERVIGVDNLELEVKVTSTKILVSYRGSQRVSKVPLEADAVYDRTYPERTLRLLSGKTGE